MLVENPYINKPQVFAANYRGKRIDVEGLNRLEARDKAVKIFKVKKPSDISIYNIDEEGPVY